MRKVRPKVGYIALINDTRLLMIYEDRKRLLLISGLVLSDTGA